MHVAASQWIFSLLFYFVFFSPTSLLFPTVRFPRLKMHKEWHTWLCRDAKWDCFQKNAKDIARIPARSAPCRFRPHLARGCGVLDSAKSVPTSRSTLGLDSPCADVTHYSTRRCSRVSVLVARYHVYTLAHARGPAFTHRYSYIRNIRTYTHTHAGTTTSSPVQSQNSRHRWSDARTRAHCPHQVVLCNFSLDSSSLFLPRLASVLFLRQVGFFIATTRFAGICFMHIHAYIFRYDKCDCVISTDWLRAESLCWH